VFFVVRIPYNVWCRHVFYADERAVPLDHPDSNHHACTQVLLSKVPIPQENIHTLDPSLLPEATSDKNVNQDDIDIESLAEAYEHVLIQHFVQKDAARFPIFDLILLGMGPDGHTASLFPGHPLLSGSAASLSASGGGGSAAEAPVDVDMRWVAPIADSPKPPPKRVTLTLSVLNHAARIAFVACGKEKVPVVKKVLDGDEGKKELLPAARVKPVYPGCLYWFLDEDAAGDLRYPREVFKL